MPSKEAWLILAAMIAIGIGSEVVMLWWNKYRAWRRKRWLDKLFDTDLDRWLEEMDSE